MTSEGRTLTSTEEAAMSGDCHLTTWRDVDSERRRFGISVWRTGGEVYVGRRLYRVRWSW